jgi:hypothetical protein
MSAAQIGDLAEEVRVRIKNRVESTTATSPELEQPRRWTDVRRQWPAGTRNTITNKSMPVTTNACLKRREIMGVS